MKDPFTYTNLNVDERRHIESMAAQILGGMMASGKEWEDIAHTAVVYALRIQQRLKEKLEGTTK